MDLDGKQLLPSPRYQEGNNMGWFDGARVNDQDARQKDEERTRVIWGGDGGPGKPGHGEIISEDGLNANYVRDPGGHVVADDLRDRPYDVGQSPNPRHTPNP